MIMQKSTECRHHQCKTDREEMYMNIQKIVRYTHADILHFIYFMDRATSL